MRSKCIVELRSFFLKSITESPLDEGLVLASKRAHGLHRVTVDLHVGDVFGVPTIAPCLVVFTTRAAIDVHKSIGITSRNNLLIPAHLDNVDMTTISP